MATKSSKPKSNTKSSTSKNKSRETLVVGVDFGTTFSSVAYSDPRKNTQVPILIKDWGYGESIYDVPTVLQYSGKSSKMEWGPQVGDTVKPGCVRKECFKLGLDPNVWRRYDCVDVGELHQELLSSINPEDNIADLCTTYLRELRSQAKKSMRKTLGSSVFDTMQKHWVITVPAVWDFAARELTRRCAIDAGFDDPEIVSEPEAAAAYALQDYAHLFDYKTWLLEGDSFVVCDVGGGTADLITYQLMSRAPVTVREVVRGTGGKCGSSFVNRYLEKMIQDRIAYQMTLTDENRGELGLQLEKAKCRFSGQLDSLDGVYIRGLPLSDSDDPAVSISNGRLFLPADDIKWAFDRIIEQIKGLLRGQIDDATRAGEQVKMVLLVGGFAGSRYLRDTLEAWLTSSYTDIKLKSPEDSCHAIALGAVVKGVSTRAESSNHRTAWNVHTRKSTAYMGIRKYVPFIEDWHLESQKFFCAVEAEDKCDKVMSWHVRPNEDLSQSSPREFEYFRYIRLGDSLAFEDTIYYSYPEQQPYAGYEPPEHEPYMGYEPPEHYRLPEGEAHAEQEPYYLDDSSTQKAILSCDLSKTKSKLPIITGKDGKRYYKLKYKIQVKFGSACLKWKVLYKGEKIGKVKCDYPMT